MRKAAHPLLPHPLLFSLLFVLTLALGGCWPLPAGPPSQRPPTDRQALANRLLGMIPPGAALSVTPELMASLGPRGKPYLFPVLGDAEYAVVDVLASLDPLAMKGVYQKVQELLRSGQFGVMYAQEGLLLLRRGLSLEKEIPQEFYDFLRARPSQEAFLLDVQFEGSLQLVAFDYTARGDALASLSTYWRAVRPLKEDYQIAFVATGEDGQSYVYDVTPASLWYPTSLWQSGEVVRVALPRVEGRIKKMEVAAYLSRRQGGPPAPTASGKGEATMGNLVKLWEVGQATGARVPLAQFIGLPFAEPTPSPVGEAAARSLCGRPLEEPALARLRPVAVKIDNAPAARPQTGLSQACVIYEHMAEGGITRFTAIYHTEDVEVGPVRSARRVDLHIVPQYQALFAHVGGSQTVMANIRAYQLLDVDQFFNAAAYYYVRSRSAPQNVYTTIPRIRRYGEALGVPPEASLEGFPFLAQGQSQGGDPAADIIIPYPNPSRGEFRYEADTGTYLRFTNGRPHMDASDGSQLRVKNVILQRVRSWIVSYTEDAQGAPSLDFDLVGEGRATIFHSGRRFEGKWIRPSLEAWTRFYDETGALIPLAPGSIWISLVSPDTEITVR